MAPERRMRRSAWSMRILPSPMSVYRSSPGVPTALAYCARQKKVTSRIASLTFASICAWPDQGTLLYSLADRERGACRAGHESTGWIPRYGSLPVGQSQRVAGRHGGYRLPGPAPTVPWPRLCHLRDHVYAGCPAQLLALAGVRRRAPAFPPGTTRPARPQRCHGGPAGRIDGPAGQPAFNHAPGPLPRQRVTGPLHRSPAWLRSPIISSGPACDMPAERPRPMQADRERLRLRMQSQYVAWLAVSGQFLVAAGGPCYLLLVARRSPD